MKKLHLGVSREIITPKVGTRLYGYFPDLCSESVNDNLTVTAFYFAHGDTKALMITATVCLIENNLDLQIRTLIEKNFGIKKDSCLLCATHTHSGPCTCNEEGWGDIDHEYCNEIFIPKTLDAVKNAIDNAKEVTQGIACGECFAAVNRRESKSGNLVKLGQNPDGCMDPKMTIISFKDCDGKPYANIIHYAGHGTAAGVNHEITRDWSGIMTDRLEEVSGCISAFFNGPEGDIGPRLSNGETAGNIDYVTENGNIAATDAVKIYNTLSDFHDADLSVNAKDISVPLKSRITLNEANNLYDKYKGETASTAGMICNFAKKVIESYESEYEEQKTFSFRQTLIRIGNIIFASFPYELFSEIGLRINSEITNASVLSLSNTNGSESYFITQDATMTESYERTVFRYSKIQSYADDGDSYLVSETVEHIKEMN